ncbi:MAG: sugar phosphate isomerase/epimerase family protein [Acidimicrobiales bacterium]
MVMRLSFSTLACPAWSVEQAANAGASYGYEGIELRLVDGELIDPAMSASARARVKSVCRAAGLAIVAVDSSIRLTGDDHSSIDAELLAFLELANAWESPVVRVFGGPLSGDARAQEGSMRAAAGVLERAAPAAERLGVRIGVETHDDLSSSAVVAQLLSLVGAEEVGAIWDSHHPYRMGESPEEVFANIGERLVLAQVKDARRSDTANQGWQLVLLGQGEVPVQEMVDVLAKGGYEGWLSVEWEKHWHPEIEEPEVALPEHRELLARWLSAADLWSAGAQSADSGCSGA